MRADVDEWFDTESFKEAVNRFIYRQGYTIRHMAILIDMAPSSLASFVLYGGELNLRLACALAEGCDLSLENYRLTQSQHHDYMDAKHAAKKANGQL